MLIMTRRVGETLIIDDDIKVTVLGHKGNQMRIGIDAPKDKTVHRQELYDKLIEAADPVDGKLKAGHIVKGYSAAQGV